MRDKGFAQNGHALLRNALLQARIHVLNGFLAFLLRSIANAHIGCALCVGGGLTNIPLLKDRHQKRRLLFRSFISNYVHAILLLAQLFYFFQFVLIRRIHHKLHAFHVAG